MNLIITRQCPNRCPYCFESGESGRGRDSRISLANAERVARWAAGVRLDALSLLGGEPFLHPELGAIVRLFRENCPRTRLTVFTGGYFSPARLDALAPDEVSLLFNINEPHTYAAPKLFAAVVDNVLRAIRRGFRTGLGFNVWETEFSPDFMPDLAHRLGRRTFRWTVAHPQVGVSSTVVPAAEFGTLAGRCLTMLQKAAAVGVSAHLDCPLPLCFFADADLGWLAKHHPNTAGRLGWCEPPLDISPDLEVVRCFALSRDERVSLADFASPEALKRHFARSVDRKRSWPDLFLACADCEHAGSGRCRGGCLARHGDGARPEGLPERLFALMAESRHDEVLTVYDAEPPVRHTPLATYLAAVAAHRRHDHGTAFRYAASVLDTAEDAELKARAHDLLNEVPTPSLRPAAD